MIPGMPLEPKNGAMDNACLLLLLVQHSVSQPNKNANILLNNHQPQAYTTTEARPAPLLAASDQALRPAGCSLASKYAQLRCIAPARNAPPLSVIGPKV